MDEIKKTKGKQIKEARTKRAAREGGTGGWRAKNSFPIKLYPFALIYRFHALSPLSTAELSGEKRSCKPKSHFKVFHFPFPSVSPHKKKLRFLIWLLLILRKFFKIPNRGPKLEVDKQGSFLIRNQIVISRRAKTGTRKNRKKIELKREKPKMWTFFSQNCFMYSQY